MCCSEEDKFHTFIKILFTQKQSKCVNKEEMFTLYFERLRSLIIAGDITKLKEWISTNGYIHFSSIHTVLSNVSNKDITEYIQSLQK